ncbi:Kinesin-like protein [Plasmodiophora brassicae]
MEPVRVVVRIRPLNDRERAHGLQPAVRAVDATTVQIASNNGDDTTSSSARRFTLDRVFDPFCPQEAVFAESGVRQLVDYAMDGYSSTVFAYGQTGSGKTFTMSGGDEAQLGDGRGTPTPFSGVIPRSLAYLIDRIDALSATATFSVQASFLEIYNEVPRDLLRPSATGLYVRWAHDGGFFVENQVVVDCQSPGDLMAVFAEGHRNRHVAAHILNSDSSRSHCILTVYIKASAHDGGRTTSGKVSFVDLAGSERLRETQSSGGQMLRETSSINRSLFLLGKVIAALGARQASPAKSHVPYRDSLLTKLLMDSLGGTGRTVMIACVSPSSKHAKETFSTLSYAARTKRIQNRPAKRGEQHPGRASALALQERAHRLEAEVAHLRQLLARHGIGADGSTTVDRTPAAAAVDDAHGETHRRRPPDRLPPLPAVAPRLIAPPQVAKTIGMQIRGLLQENVGLQDARQEQSKQYEEVVRENQRLQEKIRNLERIFIDDHRHDAMTVGARCRGAS